jgi:FemAB-related protein (PEP-CTERM system-associated)
MAASIRALDDHRAAAWDAFVLAHPNGTFFHRAAWKPVVERAFGHRTHYICYERDGQITGVLPLVRVKTMLFGDTLISVPFCVYGGPLAADAESAAALAEHAGTLLTQTGSNAVEFRHREPVDNGWEEKPGLYVTFRKSIGSDHETNMKAIPRKQRAMVRKGIQNNLSSVANKDVRLLHRIYAESVRNLGTPVFARRYFDILAEAFGDDMDVVTIRDDGDAIASVMNFYFREEVLPYYGGGTRAARGRAGNDFMYWEVMRRAADRGFRLFDFGRSKIGTGAHDFKKNWGFTPEPLHYRYKLAPGQSIPDINPLNPKYRLFIAAWKKLPLPVANTVGPFLVRGLG